MMQHQKYHLEIRPASGQDREGVISLIDAVYREYGDSVCLEGAESDLLDLPDYYRNQSGEFWVLAESSVTTQQPQVELGLFPQAENPVILGSHAAFVVDEQSKLAGFRRLYLAKHLRGTGWGRKLMQIAIDWAWETGMQRVEFWSDTRFERAHQFFETFGFRRDGRLRHMHDGNEPYSEYFFYLDLEQSKPFCS
ncbi:MAG TPA: GNAT family N-acetyltransferase [Pirellulaceae bacterium]|nr:GNAT family N-acetyltransferase [Pirellulaceae bacterium]